MRAYRSRRFIEIAIGRIDYGGGGNGGPISVKIVPIPQYSDELVCEIDMLAKSSVFGNFRLGGLPRWAYYFRVTSYPSYYMRAAFAGSKKTIALDPEKIYPSNHHLQMMTKSH